MSRFFREMIRTVLAVSLVVLTCCSEKAEVKEEVKPSIVVTNFTVYSFVDELVVSESANILNPIPVGKSPLEWKPSAAEIEEMNRLKPLVFIAGGNPSWVEKLSESIKVVDVLASASEPFSPASDLKQAQSIYKVVAREIVDVYPDVDIKDSALDFIYEIERAEVRWSKLPNLEENPEGLKDGLIRHSRNDKFLDVVAQNYDLYSDLEQEKVRLAEEQAREEERLKNLSLTYEGGVVPILERSCIDCHNGIDEEGDLNLKLYLKEDIASMHPKLWEKVSKVVSLEQMPPSDHEEQLTSEDKVRLKNWSLSLSEKWDAGEMGKDPGKTTVHRLNKNEYNYTVRDLFGLNIRPADNFPEDGGGEGGFDNNADSLYMQPLLVENYFKSAGLIVDSVYSSRSVLSRYLIARPAGKTAEAAAQEVIERWVTRIYRKPANEEEVSRLVALFSREYAKKSDYNESMKTPLYAMLVSPNFLYRSALGEEKTEAYPLSDYELASKLSYFLWSSMPDDELFRLAADGRLTDEKVLEEQVKRMLLDKKANSLGMHFGGQWFGWENLRSSANPDSKKFPEFTMNLRIAFYQESRLFFNDLVQSNGSIYKFLDSDYTFLNERLANFYRIPNVKGGEMRKVKLTDENRGGVIGMGSVLTSTSLALRSSPSIRGAYVLRDILGVHLPEAPMDVEQLPEDDRAIGAMTFRETLNEHRDNPNCSSCHGEIDPIGFGLESFDAIGRFRTHQNGVKLDASGVMFDGTQIVSPADLRKALMKNKELFVRNSVEKMLIYALGRDLTPYDRPVAKSIYDKVIQDDGSIQTAFIEVVKSYPFRYQRGEITKPGAYTEAESDDEAEPDDKPELSNKAKARRKRRKNKK